MAAHQLQTVISIDVDTFFVQVHRSLDPSLKGVPIAIQQHQDAIAISYEARALGLKKHVLPSEVRKNFSAVRLVHVPLVNGKATYKEYRRASTSIYSVLSSFNLPIERHGMDECFLDCTARAGTGDAGLQAGGALARDIQREVLEKTGYAISCGVAENKLLAKLACKMAKPAGVRTLSRAGGAAQAYVDTLLVADLPGQGGKVAQALEKENIHTVAQCRAQARDRLVSLLGEPACTTLLALCACQDSSRVEHSGPPKTVQSQCSFTPLVLPALDSTIAGADDGLLVHPIPPWALHRLRPVLRTLVEDVCERLEEDYGAYKRHATTLSVTTQMYTCAPEDVSAFGAPVLLPAPTPSTGGRDTRGTSGGTGMGHMMPTAPSDSHSTQVHVAQAYEGGLVWWPGNVGSSKLSPVPLESLLMQQQGQKQGQGQVGGQMPVLTWVGADRHALVRGAGQATTRSAPMPAPCTRLDTAVESRIDLLQAAVERLYCTAALAACAADGWHWNGVVRTNEALQVVHTLEQGSGFHVDLGLGESGRPVDWMGHVLGPPPQAPPRASSSSSGPARPVREQMLNRFTLPCAAVKLAVVAGGFQAGAAPVGLQSFFQIGGAGGGTGAGEWGGAGGQSHPVPKRGHAGGHAPASKRARPPVARSDSAGMVERQNDGDGPATGVGQGGQGGGCGPVNVLELLTADIAARGRLFGQGPMPAAEGAVEPEPRQGELGMGTGMSGSREEEGVHLLQRIQARQAQYFL